MLTDTKIKTAKPQDKPYRLADGRGLYLLVNPNGAKWWRFAYRFAGKRNNLSLGVYPDIGLAIARQRREEARSLIAQGSDPAAERRARKDSEAQAAVDTFEAIAREWLGRQRHMTTSTSEKALALFERQCFPWLGSRSIADITAPELLAVLRRVEARGHIETAQRLKQRCGQVFRYAIATGRADRDPSQDLRGALTTASVRHRAAVTDPAKFGAMLRAIDGYSGSFITACALKLSALLFVRPLELRTMQWPQLELEGDTPAWRYFVSKTKVHHVVPLSRQAVEILLELMPLTAGGLELRPDAPRYVFPSVRSRLRPMSENTVNLALRNMGFGQDEATAHGFRATASTLLHEMGWSSDVIEKQLAHAERNKVKAAYNRAEYLPERRRMMQSWSDYLDALREGRKVVAGKFGKAA